MALLQVKEITKQYSNHLALDDVSLEIPHQSIFGLLGPNGAGKTTLIRIITQIIHADKGEILMNGERLEPSHIRQIGYLPEERGLYKKMRVGEQLMYLAQLKGLSHTEALENLKTWFKKFGIVDWWRKNVEDLSKGMQQKIQFIATVIHKPQLIILDEPFSGFDPINANLIKDEILELREGGSTIIFSTHRMESVEELCDHIALINSSKKVLEGTKDDIKASFKSNSYRITHKGSLGSIQDKFEVLNSRSLDKDYYETVIRILNGTGANQLLSDLILKVEIKGFEEQMPSMNDIFIEAVGMGANG